MTLEKFLKKNGIDLPDNILNLCRQGIVFASRGRNSIHNEKHIFSLLDNLNDFLAGESSLKKESVNFSILLPAICWHDIWKSSNSETSINRYFQSLAFEGVNSAKIFKRWSKVFYLDEFLSEEIRYSIRMHALVKDYFLLKPRIPSHRAEAMILRDIDGLELFNLERALVAYKKLKGMRKIVILWMAGMVIKKRESIGRKYFVYNFSVQRFLDKSGECLRWLEEKKAISALDKRALID